jgi:L-amino acid N-acyltransferase YncA
MPQVSAKFGEWLDLVFLELLLDDRNAPGEE